MTNDRNPRPLGRGGCQTSNSEHKEHWLEEAKIAMKMYQQAGVQLEIKYA